MRAPRYIPLIGLLAACAPNPRAASTPEPDVVRWTGNFQPTQQRLGGLGPTAQNKAFGTVVVSSSMSDPNMATVRLTASLPVASASLHWAVHPGRCGSGSLPLMEVSQFPLLEIGSNGRGELETELPLNLSGAGSYHVNVYWGGGRDLSDVITCANLKQEGGK